MPARHESLILAPAVRHNCQEPVGPGRALQQDSPRSDRRLDPRPVSESSNNDMSELLASRRFLLIVMLCLACLLALGAAVVAVDPYLLFDTPRVDGLNR